MKIVNLCLTSAVILLLAIACGNEEKDQKAGKAKNPTPADYVEGVSFNDLEGNPVSLSEFKGKVVLIDFWETWCRPCLASFPTMQKLMNDYPDDFVVLAVTPGFVDTKKDAEKFVSQHDYDFEFLLDKNKLNEKLQIQSIPYKVFVDAQGNYIESSIGSYGPDSDYEKAVDMIEKYNTDALTNTSKN